MNKQEKIDFYNRHKLSIHLSIKAQAEAKPLWRKLFWTTGRDSDQYKIGCVDIFKIHFEKLYSNLKGNNGSI